MSASSSAMPETFDIGPNQYVMMPHDVDDGLAVIDKFLIVGLAPLVGALVGGKSGEQALQEVNPEAIVAGLKQAGGLQSIAPLILKNTTRNGIRLDKAGINLSYMKNYKELAQAVQEVIGRNDFFGVLLGLFGEGESTPA